MADIGDGPAVLVFDGLFLLRPELRGAWDLAVHLRAETRREEAWRHHLTDGLPERDPDRQREIDRRLVRARWPRYHDGWRLYIDEAAPESAATMVVVNDDFAHPVLLD